MKRTVATIVLLAASACTLADEKHLDVGEQVYKKWCEPCHAPGDLYPGTLALRAKYKGAVPDALIQRTDLSPELIKYFVRNGITVMPFFRKTEISDAELQALSDFLTQPKGKQ